MLNKEDKSHHCYLFINLAANFDCVRSQIAHDFHGIPSFVILLHLTLPYCEYFAIDDYKGLASHVAKIISNDIDLKSQKEIVEKEYDVNNWYKKILALYDE